MTAQASDLLERVRFRGNPLPNPASVVTHGQARFTLLTGRLVRLEWSATGRFEDRSSYAFPTRYGPTPPFSTRTDGEWLVTETEWLSLRYRPGTGAFSGENLSIRFLLNQQRTTWRPDALNPANLRGTRRTLDGCPGDASLEEGLISRAGWSLFDDSRSILFDPADGWVRPPPDHARQDWYFFGYGHDYAAALADYVAFGGRIPLIPRFLLGAWWSRYWAYSAQELQALIGDFERHGLPLDVLVLDMDWHTPHSWTGYTWNRQLFPDPPGFLRWVHKKGLRVTLNLHPAEGVQPFETVYPRFARAMGLDPAGQEPVPFRITARRFVQNYFELLHHTMEDEGVDFWWIDWQQGETSEMEGLDPLPWLNHLHYQDATRRGLRPLIYSRWGGLGNHRYPIGFSGDTLVTWSALQFQPYLTATAANVAFGWWSHDIGGHMGGATEPELYARWVQFGAVSPCLRLHATKDPLAERRPWAFPATVLEAARAAFEWRYQLVPYLYTMARVAHETGLSLCRPMAYAYPEEAGAYAARYQYLLGDQMIAAPILHPADPKTGLAAADVWVPPGAWIDTTTRESWTGPCWVRLLGDLNRIPLLIKAGGILPLAAPLGEQRPPRLATGTTDALRQDQLVLAVFPGADGRFRLYEDDGISQAYQEGQYEWTGFRNYLEGEGSWIVEIEPVEGHCPALSAARGYEIRLEGSRRPDQVTLDGQPINDWSYHAEQVRTIIPVPLANKRRPIRVTARAVGGISALGEAHNRAVVVGDARRLLAERCPPGDDLASLCEAALAAGDANAIARLGGPLLRWIEFVALEEASQHLGRLIVGGPEPGAPPFDLKGSLTLTRGPEIERFPLAIKGATGPQIMDTPFAFDGQVRSCRWEADVRLTWRGHSWRQSYCSATLFPTIHAWQTLVYHPEQAPISLEQVLDPDGRINQQLAWQPSRQSATTAPSLTHPYTVVLNRPASAEQRADEPRAAYLTTILVSPIERPAILECYAAGPAEVILNGRPIPHEPVPNLLTVRPPVYRRPLHRTSTVHLRAGENHLLIATRPPAGERPFWAFCGAVLTPAGEPIIDLDIPDWTGTQT